MVVYWVIWFMLYGDGLLFNLEGVVSCCGLSGW